MADPVTIGSIGLGLFGGLMGKLMGGDKPQAAAPQAAPESTPTGNANTNKPKPTQSFISAAAAPTQQTRGQSTLLGQ